MSLPTTKNGKEKTALATRIGKTMPPSKLYNQFTPDLQGILDGRCATMAALTARKDVPTLKDISDAYDNEDVAVEWIKIQLEKVNTFTGAKDKLNVEQLYDLGVQILNCFGNLNVLEFSLFCGRLRHGVYEKFFGSVDPMKILMSLDVFLKERNHDWQKHLEEIHKEEQERNKTENKAVSPVKLVSDSPGKYPMIERMLRKGNSSTP